MLDSKEYDRRIKMFNPKEYAKLIVNNSLKQLDNYNKHTLGFDKQLERDLYKIKCNCPLIYKDKKLIELNNFVKNYAKVKKNNGDFSFLIFLNDSGYLSKYYDL